MKQGDVTINRDKTIFCTLFDSNYLDKGIALINSLNNVMDEFILYVYAFDRKAYDILNDMKIHNLKTILFQNIETDELRRIKNSRSRAEFCWTCTPFIVEYTLIHFEEKECTYIDADLFFYKNPRELIQEMKDNKCSVQIVEHRFPNYRVYRRTEKMSGRFCVEFNTFLNNRIGRKVVETWKNQCFACCTSDWKSGTFGDQKYLDEWQDRYEGIHVLTNQGGGIAPWNLSRYRLVGLNAEDILFEDSMTKTIYTVYFYHFHDLCFESESRVNIHLFERPGRVDSELMKYIYMPYISELKRIREMLFVNYQLKLPLKNRKKELLWSKQEKISIYAKIAKLIYLPKAIYQQKIINPKNIIEME